MPARTARSPWLYLLAVAALATCLWIGWSDMTLRMPQDQVRQAIRAAPRGVVQLLVQFVIPAMLIGVLLRAGIRALGARGRGRAPV